ncbi:hypothetical protein [Priestia megaterium]|uniref:hypothetical protein n=1 Tax=Priestia megaterium TaxID=1404 RepID=UPI000BEE0A79|nr:hypothetical protein [Priestia megaterium]PEE75259.1 hypothetical protein COM81_18900 [Priestia megaterium]PFI91790.1 hypothetical protein COI84_20920 [Priestia megaterium]PGR14189.1 hypothetical protein COC62_06240 [Priestia megaterium]
MGRRVNYSVEVKLKAIEMKLAGVLVKGVLETLQTRNNTPIEKGLILKILHQNYKLKIDILKTD